MSLKFEIFRALFILLGLAEFPTNLFYLLNTNGLNYARKQHQELPKNLSDKQILVKVICLLVAGIVFLGLGLYFYFTQTFSLVGAAIVLVIFAIYAIVEAFYYRHWKTTGFAIIAVSLPLILIFL